MQQTALIAGGTGGLGGAVTRCFLEAGWRVVVPWRSEPAQAQPGLELVQADLMDPDAAAAVVATAGPSLRAVVNLVGGYAQHGRVHETPIDVFEAQLRLNLRPTYLVTAAALPTLLEAGGGAIVCVSSRAAVRPFPGASGYAVAKAAVLSFVDVLDAEYRGDGIRANAILPSIIDTPATRRAQPDADVSAWVKPAELGRLILALCSEAGAVTSGARVTAYGRA